jgi:hypothetical protein
MMTYVWLAIGLAVLSLFVFRGGRIWIDTGHRELELPQRLVCTLWGAMVPAKYWWGARIEAMGPDERADLLARETQALGLDAADSQICPLCSAQVPHAWTLGADGRPSVADGPIDCPGCDFRLDACRHCAHFLPGDPTGLGQSPLGHSTITSGRCNVHKTSQPVEQTCGPDMARRLKDRGLERVRAPMRIVDSFLPPDSCRAFEPERRRLRQGGIRWPDARRAALLRLLAPLGAPSSTATEEHFSNEAQRLI